MYSKNIQIYIHESIGNFNESTKFKNLINNLVVGIIFIKLYSMHTFNK